MPYASIPYTTVAAVSRILRTANNKIRVGSDPGGITEEDVEAYILDASAFIDSFLRDVVGFNNLPVATYQEKPEILYVAPRIAAFLIHRDLYSSYKTDQLGVGVNGWLKETREFLEMLRKHINDGVYTDLSPATGGLQFMTTEQLYVLTFGTECCTPYDQDIF